MQYGYMASFGSDILSEIEFAAKHFDFIEITYNPDGVYTQERISQMRKALGKTKAVGHLHWGCDFSLGSPTETKKARAQLELFSKIGVKEVTIHPSHNAALAKQELMANNTHSLSELGDFCQLQGMRASLENVLDAPFNRPEGMLALLKSLKGFGFTLDTGHAQVCCGKDGYRGFPSAISQRLSHVHVHHSEHGFDHLPYPDKSEMDAILENIGKSNPNVTVTFEIFYKLAPGGRARLDEEERKKIVLEHLRHLRQ